MLDQTELTWGFEPGYGFYPIPKPLQYGSLGEIATGPSFSTEFGSLPVNMAPYKEFQDAYSGYRQLGMTPQEWAGGIGGHNGLYDVNNATWDDRYGWITPESNVVNIATGDMGTFNNLLGLAALATGGAAMGGAFSGAGTAAAGSAGTGAGTTAGMGAVDYGLTAGGIPSLSTYGATGLAGTGTPMLSTYGMGGLAGTGTTSLGTLAGTAGMAGSALSGSAAAPSTGGNTLSSMMDAQEAGFTPEEIAAWQSSPVPGMSITDALTAAKSIVGGTGSISSGLAALASGAASLYGGNLAAESAENAISETRRQFDIGQANVAPWLAAGKSALGGQLDLMGLPGGTTGEPTNQLAALQSSPGYQFRLEQGRKGLDASVAARGGMGSGKAATGAIDWGQKQASSEYGNRLNQLAALSGTGQTQAQQNVASGERFASDVGSSTLAAGAARQSGILGAGNALSSFLNPVKQITGYNPVTGAPIYA